MDETILELELAYEDGHCSTGAFQVPLSIGRDPACGLRLRSWRVAKQHARILSRGGILFLEDLGSLIGSYVNGCRVTQHGPLCLGDEIIIGPCRIHIVRLPMTLRQEERTAARARLGSPSSELVYSSRHQPEVAAGMEAAAEMEGAKDGEPTCNSRPDGDAHGGNAAADAPPDQTVQHRRRLHKALLEALDLRRRDILALSDDALREEAAIALAGILKDDELLPAGIDHAEMLRQVVDEAVGLGPLEPLLADRGVSEIMVNSYEEIYVERWGRLHRHATGFSCEQAVVAVIDRIVAPLGRRVDEASPMVDARLRDGSRVNAVIPPIALRGACLTIRKFPERRLDMQDLLAVGSLDQHMASFLANCVVRRKSMIVSGGTGSGKTTLLNVLSHCVPAGERIITIEDAAELRLNHAHLVSLEARPSNAEGKGRVDIRDLVRNALRMRPDRIIVGECRGAEAFDMLSAMNTGHEGSLTTLHANSPRDALARLETMILMAGMDLPLTAIREHIASAIDLIVQQARQSDGRRLVTAIVEVTGMEGGRIQTQELFRYRNEGEPRFEGCGVLPEICEHDDAPIPLEWMSQTTVLEPTASTPWQF